MKMITKIAALSLVLAAPVIACSGDDNNGTPPPTDAGHPDSTAPGDGGGPCITATVTHEGTHGGSLRCGAFSVFPPTKPPDGQAYVHAPVFPQTVTITLPTAGTYTLACYLDVHDSDPVSPGPADFLSIPAPVTVPASGGCASATQDINEALASDAGQDSGGGVDSGSDSGGGVDSGSDSGDDGGGSDSGDAASE